MSRSRLLGRLVLASLWSRRLAALFVVLERAVLLRATRAERHVAGAYLAARHFVATVHIPSFAVVDPPEGTPVAFLDHTRQGEHAVLVGSKLHRLRVGERG